MPTFLDAVSSVVASALILAETQKVLRRYGACGNEGMVLWLGRIEGPRALVESVVEPEQDSINEDDGVGYFIRPETLRALNRFMARNELRLIAQVHSHPGRAYHSTTDDRYAIVTAEGGVSIVVPFFARDELRLSRCAVYRLRRAKWQELSAWEVERLFTTTAHGSHFSR